MCEICKDYKTGMYLADMQTKYKLSAKKIKQQLALCNTPIIETHNRALYFHADEIIHQYTVENLSSSAIGKIHNLSDRTVIKILEFNGIQKKRHGQKTWRDMHFFKNCDTEEKAYIIGFLFADGNVSADGVVQATQMAKRKDIIEQICKVFNCPIHYTEKKDQYYFSIVEPEWVKDLAKFGIVPNKSTTSTFYVDDIPVELRRHFLRGLFDGDGLCYINESNNGRLVVGFCSHFKETVAKFYEVLGIPSGVISKGAVHFATLAKANILPFYKTMYTDAKMYTTVKKHIIEQFIDNTELI